MKRIYILAVALFAVLACNKDEVKEINRGSAIDFRAAMATKASEYTDANLEEFVVTALTDDGVAYFSGVTYSKEDGSSYFTSETPYYWPASGNLHFYAYYPEPSDLGNDVAIVIDKENKTLTGYTPSDNISEQKDIIIAYAEGNRDENAEDGIAMAFAHQLSRVEVYADNTNTGYSYSVMGVRIAKAFPTGTLDFSNGSAWEESGDKVIYEVKYDSPVTISAEASDLLGGFAMLIPQNTSAWNVDEDKENMSGGSYLSVLVQINTTAGSRIYPETTGDEGDVEYAWMATPVEFNWEPGYKYVYTLKLGTGGGYVDPDETDPGEEILGGTMKFDGDVDSWWGYSFDSLDL